MAYVSDSNLTQFWGLAKGYINAEDSRYANWQKTEKAGAVTCWPVGGTELLPTVDFMFTETGPASGDKGPENPSTISGVNQIKVGAGNKNIFFNPRNSDMYGLTATYNNDGSIVLDGTATKTCIITTQMFSGNSFRSETLTVSAGNTQTSSNVIMRWGGGGGWMYLSSVNAHRTYTMFPGSTATSNYFQIRVESGTTLDNFVIWPQVELGDTVTNFEKSVFTEYAIPLGSTYYGGSIDLATGVMTVTHVNKVITSNDVGVFSAVDSCVGCRVNIGPDLIYTGTKITDKFVFNTSGNATSEHFRALSSPLYSTIVLYVSKTRLDFSGAVDPSNPTDEEMRAAFKAWIAENPVNFCGELAVPYTVQLSPTQILSLAQPDKYTPRLNTVYTDASSVQVGYAKSPIRSEYELTQAIIATEGGE